MSERKKNGNTKKQKKQLVDIPSINEKRATENSRMLEQEIKNEINLLEQVKQEVKDERHIRQKIIDTNQRDLQKDADINQQIRFDTNRVHILNKEIITNSLQVNELKDVIDTVKNTIHSQNQSLDENLQLLKNTNSADQQKIFYQQLQTQYLVIINFYLFYLFLLLSLVWGYYWFFVKEGYNIYMKWFWYLHVIFYPYLAIYFEFVLYLTGGFIFSWFNGNPFYPWNNYTSYPPIV